MPELECVVCAIPASQVNAGFSLCADHRESWKTLWGEHLSTMWKDQIGQISRAFLENITPPRPMDDEGLFPPDPFRR